MDGKAIFERAYREAREQQFDEHAARVVATRVIDHVQALGLARPHVPTAALVATCISVEFEMAKHRAYDPHCTCADCIEWMADCAGAGE